jgi:nucleotide-binding universal stress UspA family protein
MLKTILVPLTGFESDNTALDTAYIAGRSFDAHIQCVHVRADPVQIAGKSSVYDFGTGANGAELFAALEEENQLRSKRARVAFAEFCRRWQVPGSDSPPGPKGVSVAWREIEGDEVETTIAFARFHDLVVMARAPAASGFSTGGLGAVLIGSGRPLLLAPPRPPETLGSTIAIAWKDTPEAARALTAAMPLLSRASRIVVLSANEDSDKAGITIESAEKIVTQLRWNGRSAEARYVVPGGRALPDAVLETAAALGADVLVMGGYGHSRVRELVFGGFTRQVLAASPLPVFLFH